MYKITKKVSKSTVIEATGDNMADVFEAFANLEGVLCGHAHCGVCKAEARPTTMTTKDGDKFMKMSCTNPQCKAELLLGTNKNTGQLYPFLKDRDGNAKPNGGWTIWQGRQGGGSFRQSSQRPAAYEPPEEFDGPPSHATPDADIPF